MKEVPSPNFTPGRAGHQPNALVIHIMQGSLAGTDAWFSDRSSNVSAHYGIGKTGEVHHYVKEEDQAWHAGIVHNPAHSWDINPNYTTIGIEHEGFDYELWPDSLKKASAALIKDICTRWKIPLDRAHVIGHYEIDSVRRPNCPAINKSIIDELIALANGPDVPAPPTLIAQRDSLIRQLIAKLLAKLGKVAPTPTPQF